MRKQNSILKNLQEDGYIIDRNSIIDYVSKNDLIADRVIETTTQLDAIDGLTAVDGSWKIIVPKSTSVLRNWGLELEIEEENQTPIIGVLVKGKVVFLLKVADNKIISTHHLRCEGFLTLDFKIQRDVILSLERAGLEREK